MNRLKMLLPIVVGLSLSANSMAAIDAVKRKRADFQNYAMSTSETVRVSSTRVIAADYELIGRDFPNMRKNSNESATEWRERVDRWLVHETAFIAVEQTRQTVVNSAIPTTDADRKTALRPTGYNRAHLIGVDGGMMDAKGVGTKSPEQRHHGNGLATLGEVIREYLYEKAVDLIFEHSGVNAKTVGNYAVLDYGFDIIHQDGNRARAGYILRQSHQRSSGFNSGLSKEQAFSIEKTLRQYGVTSSGETFGARSQGNPAANWDYTNIQGTNSNRTLEIVDFGAFLTVDKFQFPLTSHIDRSVLMGPGTPSFVQPDPVNRLPLDIWGDFGKSDPKSDKPWIWSHELAQALAEGRADRSAVDNHLKNLLGPIENKIGRGRVCGRMFKAM